MKLRTVLLPIAAAAAISTGSALAPKPAAAAGFMQNTLANFEATSMDTSVKSQVKILAAFAYALPILVGVGSAAGVMVCRKNDNESGVNISISVGLSLGLMIAILWAYDATMVGKIGLRSPQIQLALLHPVGGASA